MLIIDIIKVKYSKNKIIQEKNNRIFPSPERYKSKHLSDPMVLQCKKGLQAHTKELQCEFFGFVFNRLNF